MVGKRNSPPAVVESNPSLRERDAMPHSPYVDGIDPYSDGYHRDLRIGRFDISYANVSSEGHAYFYDARDGLDIMDNAGWVYAPDGVSDETFNQPRLEDIGDGWYRFPC